MATKMEVAEGARALKKCVDNILESQGKGFEEFLIPAQVYPMAATDAITAADGAVDQSPEGRQQAAIVALTTALNATGEGGQVTPEQCSMGAAAILAAIDEARRQNA